MRTITLEEHFVTTAFLQATEASDQGALPQMADLQSQLLDLGVGRIAAMDEAAIDFQVLSLVALGLDAIETQSGVSLVRDINDELANAIQSFPQRLGGFATLALGQPDAAALELERCVNRLGFPGVLISGTIAGRFLDDPRFLPVFEAAAHLGVPVYLHPAPPPAPVLEAYFSDLPDQLGQILSIAGWGWHAETGLHMLRLILSGLFDRLPNLQLVIGHMGEGLPYALARSSVIFSRAAPHLRQPVAAYFRATKGANSKMNTALRHIFLLCAAAAILPAQNGSGPGKHLSTFQHVVIIFQENRTPDNLFQGLCSPPYGSAATCSTTPGANQYNIQTDNWANRNSPTGVTTPTTVFLDNAYDLSHAHTGFTNMCDADPATGKCRMDGAINVGCSPKANCPAAPQYKYVDNSAGRLNPYLDLATQYGWANSMFQTNQGPSFPAHQYLFGGTSAPSAEDDANGIFASENMDNTGIGGTNAIAGCIAESTTVVQLINADGVEDPSQRIFPCFEHQTLPDVLPSGVTWRYYAPGAGSIWTAPDAIQHICESSGPGGKCLGQIWANNVDLKPADVLTDIASCNLRNITWVIPSGANSDHANVNDGGGPSWVASIVNAIGNSSACDSGQGYWENTAIILTWDDWGGWYDHVAPTDLPYPQGGYQLGFRVPLVFISAYTPAHYINNVPHDFGSVLRFVEHNFGIPEGALHFADERADNDMQLFFNLQQRPRPYSTIAAPLAASFFINDKRPATDPDEE